MTRGTNVFPGACRISETAQTEWWPYPLRKCAGGYSRVRLKLQEHMVFSKATGEVSDRGTAGKCCFCPWERASEAAPEAVRQAVGEGCQSGWGRLLSVTNSIQAGAWRQRDSGWASAGRPGVGRFGTRPRRRFGTKRPGGGVGGYLPPFQCISGAAAGRPPWVQALALRGAGHGSRAPRGARTGPHRSGCTRAPGV